MTPTSRFSLQNLAVMGKQDGLLKAAAQSLVRGNYCLLIRDFHAFHKHLEPEALVRPFTGNRIFIGLKLHESRFVGFDRNNPAAFRWMERNG